MEKLIQKNGWRLIRVGKGSHRIYGHSRLGGRITISFHGSRDLPVGTFEDILKIMRGGQ